MKRLDRECGFYLTRDQIERLAAGRVVSERIGEEHDGQQVVVRFQPVRGERRDVFVSVKWFEWDHGGYMSAPVASTQFAAPGEVDRGATGQGSGEAGCVVDGGE